MTTFGLEDLAALPLPQIIEELDFEAILATRKDDFIARCAAFGLDFDVAELENNPGVLLLEEGAAREVVLRARGNDIARDAYLYFAAGSAVDHHGAFYDTPRLPGESDERYKARIVLAIKGRSTGGTIPRYRAIAVGASLRVADAFVYRDALTPIINVAVFATDNSGVADAELLAEVDAALQDEAVRMVNDTIVVRAAVVTVVNVTATLVLLPNTSQTVAADLAASLPATWEAVGALGRDLTVDWLRARLMAPGVHSVQSITPSTDVVAEEFSAVRIGAVTLSVSPTRAF